MSYRDIVSALRAKTPDPGKASRWLKYAGLGCLAVAAWNVVFVFFDPVAIAKLPIPAYFIHGLALLAAAGCLFIVAGRGVAEKSPGAVLWGQLAVVLVMALLAAFTYALTGMPQKMGLGGERHSFEWFDVIWMAAGVLVAMQFLVPGYFALGYLQRLKQVLVDETILGRRRTSAPPAPDVRRNPDNYCHALLPFGIYFNFFVPIGAGVLFFIFGSRFLEGLGGPGLFLLFFLLLFFGPILFNYLPSPFEKQREVIEQVTGGGSIFMLNGSWPFFRLLVYADGIEIRFFLHAWFIPYARLESISLKRMFLTRNLLIRSDLPGVPSRIRFAGARKEALLARIEACREAHLASAHPI
jgi:hypothetical protein